MRPTSGAGRRGQRGSGRRSGTWSTDVACDLDLAGPGRAAWLPTVPTRSSIWWRAWVGRVGSSPSCPTCWRPWACAIRGCPADAIHLTSHKTLAKRLLVQAGLPTPAWLEAGRLGGRRLRTADRWIVKSVWEDASLGMDDAAVTDGGADAARALLASRAGRPGAPWFAEAFVEGREFNLALLDGPDGPDEILPPAEMLFPDFPPDKPRIVGYAAKWDSDSFEYSHTVRDFPDRGRGRTPAGRADRVWLWPAGTCSACGAGRGWISAWTRRPPLHPRGQRQPLPVAGCGFRRGPGPGRHPLRRRRRPHPGRSRLSRLARQEIPMFRIRRIHDDTLPVNREAIRQVKAILKEQFDDAAPAGHRRPGPRSCATRSHSGSGPSCTWPSGATARCRASRWCCTNRKLRMCLPGLHRRQRPPDQPRHRRRAVPARARGGRRGRGARPVLRVPARRSGRLPRRRRSWRPTAPGCASTRASGPGR